MFDLEKRHIDFILKVLGNHTSKNSKYFIFGSRAKGLNKEYSDIDIAIEAEEKISSSAIAKIKDEFENSTLPYKVDIVDLKSVDVNFKALIQNSLKELK